jgi:hypothetical protein
MPQVTLIVLLWIGLAGCSVSQEERLREVPNDSIPTPGVASASATPGFVKNEQAAIALALNAWTPIYGKKNIDREKPYVAELKQGVWYVHGSLPDGWVGGVAEAWISQKDGKIIRIIHGK